MPSLDAEERASRTAPGSSQRADTRAPVAKEGAKQVKAKILAVDDEGSVLSSLRRLLRREPYELVTADSAEKALEILEEQTFRVVISDQRMPGMTGIEFLGVVRQRWPDTIRVILSGYSAVQTIIASINEGEIYKFVSKPRNDEELKGNIRQALEHFELQDDNRRMSDQIAEQNEQLLALNAELNQRAVDASAGLSSIQDLHECIAVGVITFDESELIVAANTLAGQMLAGGAELFGMPAGDVLPECVYTTVFPEGSSDGDAICGHLEYGGRSMQWRRHPVSGGNGIRGIVATIWEVVQ